MLCLKKWEGETNLVAKSLAAEHNLQSVITETYDALKASGDLSFGLDDYLLSLANEHETNLYLLQQNTPKSSRTAAHALTFSRSALLHD